MSEPPIRDWTRTPWLSVQVDHHFQHGHSSFHLHVAFEARAARTVIFGPSGSGKSSLLRAIAGLLEPNAGAIQIHGTTVWQKASNDRHSRGIAVEKRRVGLVMQAPAIFPHLTVRRNIAFALRGTPKPTQEETIRDLLQTVDAEALADRWPRELSGGQLQRVALARTLAAGPRILLLDEPFSALDAEGRQRISENLHRWACKRQVPILAVTHNLEEAFATGEEVIAMRDGRICAQGRPHAVLGSERDRLLRAMGTVPGHYVQET